MNTEVDGNRAMQQLHILGVRIDNVTEDEAVTRIMAAAHTDSGAVLHVVTANPEYVMAARRDPALHNILDAAGLVTPDGVGLLIAARGQRTPLRGRVPGVEMVQQIARRAVTSGTRIFLLGAAEGVAAEAALALQKDAPGVTICGVYAGDASAAGDPESLSRIRAADPHIVLVAYGMPRQDFWLARNLAASGARVGIGVGGTFDYLAGRVPRAPHFIRRLGLEWAYRLYREPWRWRRQRALIPFGLLALRAALRRRMIGY